jgi:hypothetical protein
MEGMQRVQQRVEWTETEQADQPIGSYGPDHGALWVRLWDLGNQATRPCIDYTRALWNRHGDLGTRQWGLIDKATGLCRSGNTRIWIRSQGPVDTTLETLLLGPCGPKRPSRLGTSPMELTMQSYGSD